MRAFIYCRISLDAGGEGQGVERQLQDCRDWCETHGYSIAHEFIDNDVSAFSGVKRPQFESMLHQLRDDGMVDTVVVWKSDRLARRGHDLQRFLDLGVSLSSVTEPEFTGSTGLLMLRILAGFAEHESGVKSERVARKMKAKRENGDPHAGGRRCFGYTADGASVVPVEATLIQEAARRILAGETVTSVLTDWTARGIEPVGGGKRWHGANFSRLLRSPRLVGRTSDGNEGTWPAILELSQWERLQVVLAKKTKVKTRSYLLTGLLHCGRCGAPMTGSPTGYRCRSPLLGGCGSTGIRTADTDDYVTRMALSAIPARNVEGSPENEVELLLQALRQAEADVAQLSKDHYVDKRISRPAYLAANDELETRCEMLRSQIAEHESGAELGSLDEIVEKWEHQSLSWRQAVLRTVLERVVVNPAASTRSPVAGRLELRWRA